MGKEIKDADFQECLKRGKITKFPAAKKLVVKELKTAGEDLKVAADSLKRGQDKWATIQAYYAMFHTARALRENADYQNEFSHDSADVLVNKAREFLSLAENILRK